MSGNLTTHAKVRLQQRTIPQLVLDWLVEFGRREFDKHGAYRLVFSKKSLKEIQRHCGRGIVRMLSKYKNAYLVMTLSGDVITVGYLY